MTSMNIEMLRICDRHPKSSETESLPARVQPTSISSDGPTNTVVYLPRRDHRCRTLRARRVPRSRLGSDRSEGHSGMARVHCPVHRLNPFKGRSLPVFNTENPDSVNEIVHSARHLRERLLDVVSTSQRLGRTDPLYDVGRIQGRTV